jgi:hypothetical protein
MGRRWSSSVLDMACHHSCAASLIRRVPETGVVLGEA